MFAKEILFLPPFNPRTVATRRRIPHCEVIPRGASPRSLCSAWLGLRGILSAVPSGPKCLFTTRIVRNRPFFSTRCICVAFVSSFSPSTPWRVGRSPLLTRTGLVLTGGPQGSAGSPRTPAAGGLMLLGADQLVPSGQSRLSHQLGWYLLGLSGPPLIFLGGAYYLVLWAVVLENFSFICSI